MGIMPRLATAIVSRIGRRHSTQVKPPTVSSPPRRIGKVVHTAPTGSSSAIRRDYVMNLFLPANLPYGLHS
jgi:hypothetical protein